MLPFVVVLCAVAFGCSSEPVDVMVDEVLTREGSQWIDIGLLVCNPERLDVDVVEHAREVQITATALNPSGDDCALSVRRRLDHPLGNRAVRMRETGQQVPVVLEGPE